jgi:antitoxin (DNA-binding transcriptional repressor) of toxin-antitoxin stability system
MIRIGVRELRQHAGRDLQRVKAGETIEVRERSALIKPVFREVETAALRQWLRSRVALPWFSSELSRVEIVRPCPSSRLPEG